MLSIVNSIVMKRILVNRQKHYDEIRDHFGLAHFFHMIYTIILTQIKHFRLKWSPSLNLFRDDFIFILTKNTAFYIYKFASSILI